jgi:tryptophan 2,3-dioxygenase
MKDVKLPTVSKSHVTANGVRLVVESWPAPIRNRLGRQTGYRPEDIITSVSLQIYQDAERKWMNPELMENLRDLEDPRDGPDYRAEMAHKMHLVLMALGTMTDEDWVSMRDLVLTTRQSLYVPAE